MGDTTDGESTLLEEQGILMKPSDFLLHLEYYFMVNSKPGVYEMIDADTEELLYVGSTTNLRKRLKEHHSSLGNGFSSEHRKVNKILRNRDVGINVYYCDNYRGVERDFIINKRPLFNVVIPQKSDDEPHSPIVDVA